MIASTTGDLNLDTGSLEYSNIKDKDRSYNVGGGVNVGSSNSVNATYGFTDNRQTNFATIGEGTITVRDGNSDLVGLNRDTTISQYNTLSTGLQGGFTVDTATVNLVTHPVNTVLNTVDAIDTGIDKGTKTVKEIEKQTEIAVEKTGNAIEYGHYTTDDKVQYCLNMDDYEAQKAAGGEITALDTLVYVKSKSAAGYGLTGSDVSDLRLASGYVIDDATNGIRENLETNIRVNSREEVLASLSVLDRFDSEDAASARDYLSGVRESERREQTSELRSEELRQGREVTMFANEGVSAQGICGGVDDVIFGAVIGANTLATGKNQYGEEATNTEKGFAVAIILPVIPIGSEGKIVENIGEEAFEHADDLGRAVVKGTEEIAEHASEITNTEKFLNWLNKGEKNYSNYIGKNPETGENAYTGITNNFERRVSEWSGTYDLDKIANTGELTRNQSRCIEQVIKENNPEFNNVINSISPKRDIYDEAVQWGNDWLKNNGSK